MSAPGAVPIRPGPQKLGSACPVLAPAPVGSQPAPVGAAPVRLLAAARVPRRPLPPPPGRAVKRRGTYSAYVPAPQPTNVLRRNARERNRVKQVNHGFTALRNHIPGAAKNKKLSKVDTLRRAMEYIQSLQQQLEEHAEGRLTAEEEPLSSFPSPQTEPHFTGYLTPSEECPTAAVAVAAAGAGYLTPPGYLTPCEEQPGGYLTPQSSPLPCQPSPLTLTPSSLASVDSGVSVSDPRPYPAGPLQPCPDTPSPTPSYDPTARPDTAGYGYSDELDGYPEPEGDFSPEDEELLDAISWWQSSQ